MASNVTKCPSDNVKGLIEGAWNVWKGSGSPWTLALCPGSTRPEVGFTMYDYDCAESVSVSGSNREFGEGGSDLGSCCFNFERHRLGIVIRDREGSYYNLSEWP